MTDKQAIQLAKNPETKKAIAILTKYAALEQQLKISKKEAELANDHIKQAMIDNNIFNISGDWGYITLAERTNYKLEDGVSIEEIPEKYSKRVLDTDKVKAEATLTGALPGGVAESKTQYITKKFKEVK